ncbi:hypothetical protein OOT46_24700 [Aquabacterium sp. A7-Y]|uniref:hypothetical protein n=1 Tax=Aquabacterium sp. A7-Y TaxID=1349605 RepID=UPI00223E4AAB|nr:hypothetical protein [Aquabacterium sp. A7-Y]MCW7541026.1 hypothetical protein [Aquabacterium sp. A7-Y]
MTFLEQGNVGGHLTGVWVRASIVLYRAAVEAGAAEREVAGSPIDFAQHPLWRFGNCRSRARTVLAPYTEGCLMQAADWLATPSP